MRCNGCGKKLADNATVCPVCGRAQKPVSSGKTTQQPYQPKPQQQPFKPNQGQQPYQPKPQQQPYQPKPQQQPFNPNQGQQSYQSNYQPQQPQQKTPLTPPQNPVTSGVRSAAVSSGKLPTKALIAAGVCAFLLIAFLLYYFVFRPDSKKIIGTWYAVEYSEEGTNVTFDSETGHEFATLTFNKNGLLDISYKGKSVTVDYKVSDKRIIVNAPIDSIAGSGIINIDKLTNSEMILIFKDGNKTGRVVFEKE